MLRVEQDQDVVPRQSAGSDAETYAMPQRTPIAIVVYQTKSARAEGERSLSTGACVLCHLLDRKIVLRLFTIPENATVSEPGDPAQSAR